jgi:gluconokinase
VTDKPRQPPCALIIMGVSGSGKSTIAGKLAERLRWTCEDGDRFHPKSNVEKMSAGHPLTDEDRRPWLQAIADEIDRVCRDGEHAVIACSALKHAYREILVHGRDDVRIIYLKGNRDLIAGRLRLRKDHFMPPALLESQFNTLEEPGSSEDPIVADIAPPADTIVDHIVDRLQIGPTGQPLSQGNHS